MSDAEMNPSRAPESTGELAAKSAPAFSLANAYFLFSVAIALGSLVLAALQLAFQNFSGSALSTVLLAFFGGTAVAAKSRRRRKVLWGVVAPSGLILALYVLLAALRLLLPNVIVEPRQPQDVRAGASNVQ